MKQAEPFDAGFHLGEEVLEVAAENGGFRVVTSGNKVFQTKTVFVAGGVGSFQPRKLRLPEAQEIEGTHVNYKVKDPSRYRDKRIVILGGGDSALDWALALHSNALHLTLVHRRDEFRGAPATLEALERSSDNKKIDILRSSKLTGINIDGKNLVSVEIKQQDDQITTIPADDLLVFYGLSPKLGPIADWDLDINRKTINVDIQTSSTNICLPSFTFRFLPVLHTRFHFPIRLSCK